MKSYLRIFLFMFCFVAVACNGPSDPQEAKRYAENEEGTQALLEAEDGPWEVQDEKPKDPLQAHLWARQQVDPNDRADTHVYTTKEEPEGQQYAHVMHLKPGTLKLHEEQKHPQHREVFKMPKPETKPKLEEKKVEVAVAAPEKKPEFREPRGLKAEVSLPVEREEVSGSSGGISNVRIGEHPGKTRIVFDADQPVNFSYNFDESKQKLLVDFKTSEWGFQKEGAFDHSFLEGFEAQSIGNKTRFVLALKKPGRVLFTQKYKPNNVYGNHRIVIDVSML